MRKLLFDRFMEDRGSWWFRKISNIQMNLLKSCSGFIVKIVSFLKGVDIQPGCRFFGVPHFTRFPYSRIEIGKNCTFRSDHTSNLIGVNHKCILSTRSSEAVIIVGDNCGFSGVSIGAILQIRIGNNVLCGANVIITDNDWHPTRFNSQPKPVIIENNVWLGVNTTVLKGVTIGANSIIGANSLVLRDIPPNVIAAGNPCKVIKKLS